MYVFIIVFCLYASIIMPLFLMPHTIDYGILV